MWEESENQVKVVPGAGVRALASPTLTADVLAAPRPAGLPLILLSLPHLEIFTEPRRWRLCLSSSPARRPPPATIANHRGKLVRAVCLSLLSRRALVLAFAHSCFLALVSWSQRAVHAAQKHFSLAVRAETKKSAQLPRRAGDPTPPPTDSSRNPPSLLTISSSSRRSNRTPAAPPASTTGTISSSPFLLVTTGLSTMREAEPTTSPTMVVHVAYPESSDSSVTLLHDANAASSPSSPTAVVESKQSSDAITSPVLMAKGRKIKPFPDSAEVVEDKQPHLRMSTGSFTQSQQELLDQRRHTFCAMTADGRALLRRRSHDFTDYASMTLPHPNTAYLQARSKNHAHMRVYNKTDADDREISAHQSEGPAMVDVLCPSKRTVWRRGQPVCIEWKVLDESVEFVRIELMEQGSPATTTIAKEAPNNGFFTYLKVPWGMQSGPTYFLRISSTADPTRYMTTSFFQIGTAP